MEFPQQDSSDTYAYIWEMYFKSHVQQLACSTITTEIIKGDLQWINESKSKNNDTILLPEKSLPVDDTWIHFVKDFILHLHLFGYVVYRLALKKEKSQLYEIAPPSAHYLYKDHSSSWKIAATNTDLGSKLKGSKLWNVSIFSPPIQYSSDNGTLITQLTSPGFKSIPDTEQLLLIEDGFRKREIFNSTPTVFTQVSKNIIAAGDGKRPWFKPAALPSMFENSTAPDVPQDFNAIVEDRAEAIQKLDEISERARARARDMYDNPSASRVGIGLAQKKRKIEHRELIVSDGRDAQPAPYLRAPEHVHNSIDKHQNRIMFAWGVPPQVLGQNINSERTAASNRLSDMAISGFDAHIKLIRHYLQHALKKLSRLISKNPSVYIQIKPCISTYALTQLESILTTEACTDIYSCVYQIPKRFINVNALKLRQQNSLLSNLPNNQISQNSSLPEQNQKKSKNRPDMSQNQKDLRSIDNSKKPSSKT